MGVEWSKAVEILRARLGTEVAWRWIEPLKFASSSDHVVVLEAPNQFFRDWVLAHYEDILRESVEGRQIRVVTAPATEQGRVTGGTGDPVRASVAEERRARTVDRAQQTPLAQERFGSLNPKFTFDRFVVGSGNRFAHAASLAVAESPAKAYNPLFVYGGVGLGKTHLMQAIGHAIADRRPAARVFYTSSEQFTNELILAIQTRTTARFRDRYRTVDALLVDDVHFIAGRESTQEEFFHTFNALYDAHKQIVISSDRPPKDIAGLEERVVSRFEWGLVTDIQPPDLETRIAILRKKAEESSIQVPDEVTDFIAQRVTTNIRELEGALIRVVAYCRFFSKSLEVSVAQDVLKDMVQEVSVRLTAERIQESVGAYFRLSPEVMRSVSRQRSILYPRQVAMYLCRKLTDSSLPEIGRVFGGRNHTTVIHAIEKIEREIAQDGDKKRLIDRLMQHITTSDGKRG
ncbi:MAG: chromosomal replication initiator protein DnaA [Candidatus Omnitrophica bacterium]|nr:chromosomal replication initiator protein DnaA [Candidatus Omnitrophota bacterium]